MSSGDELHVFFSVREHILYLTGVCGYISTHSPHCQFCNKNGHAKGTTRMPLSLVRHEYAECQLRACLRAVSQLPSPGIWRRMLCGWEPFKNCQFFVKHEKATAT